MDRASEFEKGVMVGRDPKRSSPQATSLGQDVDEMLTPESVLIQFANLRGTIGRPDNYINGGQYANSTSTGGIQGSPLYGDSSSNQGSEQMNV